MAARINPQLPPVSLLPIGTPMLVLDVYNVLHAWASLGGGPDEPARKTSMAPIALARLVERSRYRRRGSLLVCDGSLPPGPEPDRPPESHQVLYAGPGVEADLFIERLIARDSAPGRLLVVSTDRRIRSAARRRRAKAITSEAFVEQVLADASAREVEAGKPQFAKEVPLSRAAVEFWLLEFGYALRPLSDGDPEAPVLDVDIGGAIAELEAEASASSAAPVEPVAEREPPEDDPELRSLLDETEGSIDPDELDMDRWV
ncbi:MAG: NYN domain-containing protein [Planctomycetota bacterium]